MFERLSSFIDNGKSEELDEQLKISIVKHLQSMESEFKHYFPELKEQKASLAKNQFSNSLQITDIPDKMQDQFCLLITNSSARSIYQEKSPTDFWCNVSESYPQISQIAFRILLPFATTYFCESGFSGSSAYENKGKKPTESQG